MTRLRIPLLLLSLGTCACVVYGKSAVRHGGDPVTKKEPYGYTVVLEPTHPPDPHPVYGSGEVGVTYRGEFIGCDDERIYILLHDPRLDPYMAFEWKELRSGRIRVPSMAPLWFALWTVAGGVSTLSHGYFAVGTLPMWGVVGMLDTLGSIPAYKGKNMDKPCKELALYSRYPQGIPEEIKKKFEIPAPPASAAGAWITPPWGGFGFFGSLVIGDVSESTLKQDAEGNPAVRVVQGGDITGGAGVFGEYMVLPCFTAGAEISVDFPRPRTGDDSDEEYFCAACHQNFIMRFLFRGTFPIRADRRIFLYPLILAGYSFYFRGIFSQGLSLGTGIGIQAHTRIATPFFEARYMLHLGWFDADGAPYYYSDDFDREFLLHHAAVLAVGIRIP